MSLRPGWSTLCVPGQPMLRSETLSQKIKVNKSFLQNIKGAGFLSNMYFLVTSALRQEMKQHDAIFRLPSQC